MHCYFLNMFLHNHMWELVRPQPFKQCQATWNLIKTVSTPIKTVSTPMFQRALDTNSLGRRKMRTVQNFLESLFQWQRPVSDPQDAMSEWRLWGMYDPIHWIAVLIEQVLHGLWGGAKPQSQSRISLWVEIEVWRPLAIHGLPIGMTWQSTDCWQWEEHGTSVTISPPTPHSWQSVGYQAVSPEPSFDSILMTISRHYKKWTLLLCGIFRLFWFSLCGVMFWPCWLGLWGL